MLDIKTLEGWLWDAACSIRGPIDAPKYKDYILPLIFVRRLSDVYDDEIEKLAKGFGDKKTVLRMVKQDHELVRFYIPEDANWNTIRKATVHIGVTVTDAMRAIARENPKLQGVIDIVDYNASVSGERIISDEQLSALIEIIGRKDCRLGLNDCEPDILGRAYEYLLRKFAEGSGQSAGEFLTPRQVGLIMAKILNPQEGQTAYDPACGSGGLLIKLQLELKRKVKDVKAPLHLFGQEISHTTFAMAKMNMVVHDMAGDVAIGDTLKNPKFLDGSALRKFDIVTANPMWNQDGYNSGFYENDPHERFGAGYPPKGSADWGWVQHMFASVNGKGKLGIVLDTGAVARGSGSQGSNREKDIRKWFVDKDYIEGVLLLPENLFYNTSAPGIVMFLNKAKPKSRKNKIILINANKMCKKGRPKNYIPDGFDEENNYQQENDLVSKIAAAFHMGEDVDKLVKVINTEELVRNDYNLSPSRYVETAEAEVYREIPEILGELEELEEEAKAVNKDLKAIFSKLGLKPEARV